MPKRWSEFAKIECQNASDGHYELKDGTRLSMQGILGEMIEAYLREDDDRVLRLGKKPLLRWLPCPRDRMDEWEHFEEYV